ncbi:tyrosine-type recombinase/integrase [Halovivax gelatinilyticus]|uniref:tyrosine-type recombinase/integrase n=1 Tax=Halovivax gelatinilyticus TaxID=2961597 RepID=UPI0020CA75B9|nr:site-specific integrase [Halovivax gelatinilyticus]
MFQDVLGHRRAVHFFKELDECYEWMVTRGIEPNARNPTGYEESSAENYLKRLGKALPHLWLRHGGFTLEITNDLATWYVEQLEDDELTTENGSPYAASTKRKHVCAVFAMKRWRADQRGDQPWRPHTLFEAEQPERPMADPITLEERSVLREHVLEYNTITRYNNCTPEQRDRIRAELAQRLGKPKADVTKDDWERVNTCWKYPSLIYLSLDTGLRPIEVATAKVEWVNLSKETLEVPKSDSVKNDARWENPITSRTADTLERWFRQRAAEPAYDDTDLIWLTREGNPYSSGPLGRNLRKLLEDAGVDISDRNISWYSLRHSLGTHYARVADNIDDVRRQLRHKTIEATLRYIHPPDEDVRDNLNRI